MKASEVREHLAQMDGDQLRFAAEQLYKMLPRKMASGKGADLLLADPAAFQQSCRARRTPEMPDLDLVEMETDEFLEDAAASRYFAPNSIISKAQRGRWRFVAKRLYQDWCLLARQSENRPAAAAALEKLYGIFCRGSQVYLFRTSAPFQAIKVPRSDFFEQIFLINAQLHPAAEWIPHALSLLIEVKSEESTPAEMRSAFLSLLTTTELKASAIEMVAAQMAKYPAAARASEFSDASRARTSLLGLAFQILWAMGEKDRAVQWVRTHAGGEKCDERQVLRLVLETGNYDFWMSTYEAIQLRDPSSVNGWEKTFEKAKADRQLPHWQVM
jgi:hypothetical protein